MTSSVSMTSSISVTSGASVTPTDHVTSNAPMISTIPVESNTTATTAKGNATALVIGADDESPSFPMELVIGGGGAVLLVVLIIVSCVLYRRKRKKTQTITRREDRTRTHSSGSTASTRQFLTSTESRLTPISMHQPTYARVNSTENLNVMNIVPQPPIPDEDYEHAAKMQHTEEGKDSNRTGLTQLLPDEDYVNTLLGENYENTLQDEDYENTLPKLEHIDECQNSNRIQFRDNDRNNFTAANVDVDYENTDCIQTKTVGKVTNHRENSMAVHGTGDSKPLTCRYSPNQDADDSAQIMLQDYQNLNLRKQNSSKLSDIKEKENAHKINENSAHETSSNSKESEFDRVFKNINAKRMKTENTKQNPKDATENLKNGDANVTKTRKPFKLPKPKFRISRRFQSYKTGSHTMKDAQSGDITCDINVVPPPPPPACEGVSTSGYVNINNDGEPVAMTTEADNTIDSQTGNNVAGDMNEQDNVTNNKLLLPTAGAKPKLMANTQPPTDDYINIPNDVRKLGKKRFHSTSALPKSKSKPETRKISVPEAAQMDDYINVSKAFPKRNKSTSELMAPVAHTEIVDDGLYLPMDVKPPEESGYLHLNSPRTPTSISLNQVIPVPAAHNLSPGVGPTLADLDGYVNAVAENDTKSRYVNVPDTNTEEDMYMYADTGRVFELQGN